MSLHAPVYRTSEPSEHLTVPSKGRGHRHRRSAAISLDWRHVTLPPVDAPAVKPIEVPASYSPTLTFASTLSDTSVEEENATTDITFTQPDAADVVTATPRRRVAFSEEIQEIPGGQSGDTWMKAEDYSWPTPSTDSKTVLLDALEPSIDLAPAIPTQVPGSPVFVHRKKRSSFLQSTKNVLTRRPSKKRPVSSAPVTGCFEVPIPAPKSSMIDLDLVLAPNTSLRHKKSGSLGAFSGLPASPSKPKSWHKRSDSAPADLIFSFSPRPASPESRKRKMSSIVEHPNLQLGAPLEDGPEPASLLNNRHTGICQPIADDMIFGEPGDMVSTTDCLSTDSPAIAALKGHSAKDSLSRSGSRKGWKGMLHRLLH